MSMLEDRPSYNNVLESAQDMNNNSRHRRSKLEYKYQDRKTQMSSIALEAPWMSLYYVVSVLVKNIVRHRFFPNKSSAVCEKTSPRSDLRWKPTGRILSTFGLRWVPTGKIFTSCTSKADSESTHGSNVDIFKIRECKQTLDLSAGTSINVQHKQRIDFSADTSVTVDSQMM
ncbi:hypothetical protein Tco_1227854 [Tanacetum coccineum]